MFFRHDKTEMPTADSALPGRESPMPLRNSHFVLNTPLQPPFPEGCQTAMFGMGCFWGAERRFWQLQGVYSTAVGYAAGFTQNPNYEEVCTGRTGHNEVVLVVYDPQQISYTSLLKTFWEAHNPTQGMRQGNDVGTQYRSGIYTYDDEQATLARKTQQQFQQALRDKGLGEVTTEIQPASEFFYAEDYHQQYLAKNPNGYCGLGGTGACLPEG